MTTYATHNNRHSPDFRSAIWQGESYTFTASQAAIVSILWRAWANGTPDVSGDYLLTEIDSGSRHLGSLFPKHRAWGAMIVRGATNGTRRLAGDGKNSQIVSDFGKQRRARFVK